MTDSEGGDVLARFVAYRSDRDRHLRDELILEHQGFARSLARRYEHRGENLEDLQQVALLGLLKAVERFDPERGVAFTTFAAPTITGEIKRHFRDRAWALRVPRSLQELALRLTAVVGELGHEFGRSPTIAEIAERLGTKVEAVLEAMEVNRSYTASSLDSLQAGETTARRLEAVVGEVDPGIEDVDRRMVVQRLLHTLPDRERLIVQLRFFEGMTQSEIAEKVGVSQIHVSRLLARSLDALRLELA